MQKHSFIHRNVHGKKVLALVLAFACAFTMFAGAAFTDAADISQTEAVDMLTALGVIDGYEDGSFQPDKTVTRAEMAKMIYIIRTGSSDASAYNDDATTFTDITDHWARGYIKYCQSLGVISGKSTTIFDPNSTVTTQEAAKMLLVTLGYNAERAGLEGTGWGQKTTALADENGLLKDVNCGTTQGMPRQYAAQLIYNAIFANTVSLRDGEYTKYGYDNSLNPTIGEKYMDLYKTEAGVLFECDLVDGKDYYTITTSGYIDANKNRVTSFNKVPTDVSSLIGQEVIVLRKINASDETVYGVYADEDSKVVATGYASQLEADGNDIKLNGTSYKTNIAHGTNSVYDINHDVTATENMDNLFNNAAKGTVNAATAATEIKLIDNTGDGKVDLSVQTPATVAKVTAVSKTAINVRNLDTNAVSTIKLEDADVYEGVAKDDYVTIIDADNRSNDKDLVTKMDVVSAEAEATRGTPVNEVRVNGTWYKVANENGSLLSVTTGNSYDFVMIGGVVVVADETAASASSIAYISAIEQASGSGNKLETTLGETTGTVKVRMFFQDGTDKEVKVSKIDGLKIKATAVTGEYAGKDDLKARTMYTYAELSDGTYDVKEVNGSNDAGMDYAATTIATGSTVYNEQKISKTSVADDAIVFVSTNDETKVLTGKQINSWGDTVAINFEANTQMLTKDTNGIKYVKYAVLSCVTAGDVPGATEDRSYAYLLSNPSQETVNGETKGAYEVWTGTETTTLFVDASKATIGVAGDVISYATNGNFIEDIKLVGHKDTTLAASTGMSFILGVDGGNLRFIGNDGVESTYEFSDDCVFIAINDDKTEGVSDIEATMDNISYPATEVVIGSTTYYVPNAYVVYDSTDSNKIVAVIYDADDGKLDVPTNVNTYLVDKSLY